MTVTIVKVPRSGSGTTPKKGASGAKVVHKDVSGHRTGRNPKAAHTAIISGMAHLVVDARSPGEGLAAVTASALLGEDAGKHLSAFEWAAVARRGVQPSALEALTNFLEISQADFSAALDIPVRTLIRRKAEGVMNRDESAKLVRVARVIERAEEVFESATSAREWLKRANASLGGEPPISLLDTEFGAETVMDTLGRIEHGVFA